jgi:hypothetical protein
VWEERTRGPASTVLKPGQDGKDRRAASYTRSHHEFSRQAHRVRIPELGIPAELMQLIHGDYGNRNETLVMQVVADQLHC